MPDESVQPSPASKAPLPGLDVARRVIYRGVPLGDSWTLEMLTAIAACKALGVSSFEIDVTHDAEAKAPARDSRAGGYFFRAFLAGLEEREADAWKYAAERAAAQITGEIVVTIYAVLVE